MWKYLNFKKVGKPKWSDLSNKREVAIEYCLSEMQFYENQASHNRVYWKIWQDIAIISGILATILAAIPSAALGVSESTASIARVVPTALSALSATVLGVYNYKGECVRQGITYDTLQGELAKFLSSAQPYNDSSEDKNISLFMTNVRTIVAGELSEWGSRFRPKDNSTPPNSQP